jgi:hypothetical protein
MATNDCTQMGVDEESEEAIRRFWTASTLKAVAVTAIGKAIAERTNPPNGLVAKGKA